MREKLVISAALAGAATIKKQNPAFRTGNHFPGRGKKIFYIPERD